MSKKAPINSAHEASQPNGWLARFKALSMALLILVGCLGFGVYVIAHWAERQILTTDNWVSMVAPLPKQPVVSTALGSYVSDQIFTAVDVEKRIEEALPPKASFLASPLANQVHTITTKASQNLVASDQFQTVWIAANRIAINRVVSNARGETPQIQSRINEKFSVDLSSARGQLSSALGTVSNAVPALEPASNKVVALNADLKARPHRLQQAIKTVDYLAVVLPVFVVACFLFTFALSTHRRHTAIVISISLITVMLLELVALKGARQEILNQVQQASNLNAVGYIFDVLTGWLKDMIGAVIVIMLAVIGLLLAGGPAKWAKSLRSRIRLDSLRSSRAMKWWHVTRSWTAQHEYYLWLGGTLLILIYMALFATITGQMVINSLLIILATCSLIHIIATKPETARSVN